MDIIGLCCAVALAMLMGAAIANRHPDIQQCKALIQQVVTESAKEEISVRWSGKWNLGGPSRYWDIQEMCSFLPDLRGPYESIYFNMAGKDYVCEGVK